MNEPQPLVESEWNVASLIGRAAERDKLTVLLRDVVPQGHGRIVVLTGPEGIGRTALARWALWFNPHRFHRAIEIDVATGKHRFVPNTNTVLEQILRSTQHTVADISQRVPYGTLITFLMSLMGEKERGEQIPRLRSTVPTPRMIRTLIGQATQRGPFALYLNGLDNPQLDPQWIESVATLVEFIYDNRSVLVLLSLRSDVPLDRNPALLQTPLMERLRAISGVTIENLHLGPVSADDVAHYIHEAADEQVVRQLHALSGGWPLLVQTIWQDWRNPRDLRRPIIQRDNEGEPWYFTAFGTEATRSADDLLDYLLTPWPALLSSSLLGSDRYSRLRTLRNILALAALEGDPWTGPVIAQSFGVPWDQGIQDVFAQLCAAGILTPASAHSVTDNGVRRTLPRWAFKLPLRHLLLASIETSERPQRAAAIAGAIAAQYGAASWQRAETLLELWSDLDEAALVAQTTALCRQYLSTVPLVVQGFADLIADDADPLTELLYVLSLGALEGTDFTGEAIARTCDLPWDDGLEDVFDALVDARVLADAAHFEIPSAAGPKKLYRYSFKSPTWVRLFANTCTADDRADYAYALAEALEDTYGDAAWKRGAPIVALWDTAREPGFARNKQHYFEQRAYIEELRGVANEAEAWSKQYNAWGVAGRAWLDLAIEMFGYVDDDEMFATFDRATAAAEKAHDGALSARILADKANRANVRNRFDLATPAVRDGLALLDHLPRLGTEHIRGILFHEQGVLYKEHLNDLDAALDFLHQARVLHEQHSPPHELAATLHEISRVHHELGDLDTALDFYHRARVLDEKYSPPRELATTLYNIGRVHHERDDLDAALDFYHRARAQRTAQHA